VTLRAEVAGARTAVQRSQGAGCGELGSAMSSETDRPEGATTPPGPSDDVAATLKREGQATLGLAPDAGTEADLPRLAPGEQLAGRFAVLRFVARGGMGAVYEANDVILRAGVALKVLQGKTITDAAAMERFRREVLLARRIGHPNVCHVYELYQTTTAAGAPIHFLTMEFLEGETLAVRIARQGRFSTVEALPLVQQMCDGLAAAHAEGVIHRDFKSSNVMLVPRPGDSGHASGSETRVAITDFGIARALEPVAAPDALTGGAAVLGTPEYMAPEQVTGAAVSPATDVYALGVVMYEMVTGRLPFSAETPLATAARRINEPPPRPELASPGLDPRWSRTILRCLDRDPRRRFQDTGEVAAALSAGPAGRRWPLALAGAGVLLLGLLGLAVLARQAKPPALARGPQAAAVAARPSIAVLPFVDMSAEHNQEYFSDGIAQEIINALAQVPGLHVAARSSSFSFKGKSEDLRTVGQKLDVAHVLEGSVRKSGGRLRITAQLVSTADGYQLWSETFDRELTDIFAVQDQIARAVVAALRMKVLPDGAGSALGRRATTPEAYTLYLRGLQLQNTGSVSGLRAAIEEFERAVALDPGYAPAHARIAESAIRYANSVSEAVDVREWSLRALREAERAVELDPNGIEGLVARALIRNIFTWDRAGARADVERAVALGPSDANAQRRYSQIMAGLGHLPEAIGIARTAVELDPVSPEILYQLGNLYNSVGEYALATQVLRKALAIAPEHGLASRELAFTELLDGRPAEALSIFRAHHQEWVRNFGTALAQHSLGRNADSQAALDRLVASSGKTAQYQIAAVHAWRGERDLAFEWLEKARLGGDAGLQYFKYDPLLRSLRSDPRYTALLEKLKLPPD
jgi:TolB-like protein/tetratricopeptide (TPR) repeat protein/tRNA A-37 threonylcarbamoyl transferase component Bud32